MFFKISKAKILFFICLSFIFGVAFHSLAAPETRLVEPFYLYVAFLALFILSFFGFFIFPSFKPFAVLLVLTSFFILGLWRFALSIPVINEAHIAHYNGRTTTLRGTIVEEPDIRDKSVRYVVKISNFQFLLPRRMRLGRTISNESGRPKGNLLLIAKPFPEYRYGDELEIKCDLEKPSSFSDFDYPSYLARSNIYSICRFPERLRLAVGDKGNWLMAKLYFLKNKFSDSVDKILPEPQAAFLGGILYGAKRGIPEDLKESFKRTGTSHLVALSGYNISVVAGFITVALSRLWLPRRVAFPLAVVGIAAFTLLTGAQASVVRAAIMGVIVLLAKNVGRLSRARNILALSAALMLIQNPRILVFDLGFQLSFLATIGLVLLSPYFEEKFRFFPDWLGMRGAASATFAALILTLPLILYNFGVLSLIAPLANLAVVPFIPLTMALGFVAASAGLVFSPLGVFAGWFAWLPLTYEISVIKWLAQFPVVEYKIPLAALLVMYGVILGGVWQFKKYETLKHGNKETF